LITIPRSLLDTFRSVVKRAAIMGRRVSAASLSIVDNAEALYLRAANHESAVEYRQPGQGTGVAIHLSLEVLDRWAGKKNEILTLEPAGPERLIARWTDGGVPRQTEETPLTEPNIPFPAFPTDWCENDPELWSGLADAAAATDSESSRFALGCIHLRGEKSKIEATDGRHAFIHAGYQFPFTDNRLLPVNKVLGCRELVPGESFGIGVVGDAVAFRVGDWRVMLALQKEGRFPRLDDVIPAVNFETSRLTLSPEDAKFLEETLPRLPCDNVQNHPITLDLNGEVLVRSRE